MYKIRLINKKNNLEMQLMMIMEKYNWKMIQLSNKIAL